MSARQSILDDLQARLTALLRAGPAADLERNVRAMLGHAFQRLDLVTREEFEIQLDSVARLRERIAQLERAVERLESAQRDRNPTA
jgi:ubiquinone biosynthesis accessory factor UbiK